MPGPCDAIDWAAWEHAYGPATDVPDWLTRIGGPDPDDARVALGYFEAAVNHQGWAFNAAVPATPFLVEIVRDGRGPLSQLVVLLGDLAVGGFHGNYLLTGLGPEGLPAEYLPARTSTAAAHDVFLVLLANDDPTVRAAATVPLGVLVEHASNTLPALRARLAKEKAKVPLACALLAIGLLHTAARSRKEAVAERDLDLDAVRELLEHETSLVQFAARLALLQMDPNVSAAQELLLDAATRPSPDNDVPWNGGELAPFGVQLAVEVLAAEGDLDTLVGAIDALGAPKVIAPLLRVLFGDAQYGSTQIRLFRDLDPRAQGALRALATWVKATEVKDPYFYSRDLETYGLFDLPRQSGLVPARALDADHEGEPRWVVGRRVRDGRAPLVEWSRCLDDLGEEDIADIARELATIPVPYRLSRRWRPPSDAGDNPAFGYGYDSERAAAAAYDALIEETLRRLPATRLETFMDVAVARRWSFGLAPLVATYLSKLGAAPLPERFTGLLPRAFDDLHALPETLRARAALLDRATLESIVESLPFNLYVGAGRGGQPHVYPRTAYLLADLCPSPKLAAKAVGYLVAMRVLYADGDASHGAELTEEAIAFFTSFFRPFGPAVAQQLEDAAAGAAPQIAALLKGTAGRLRRAHSS